MGQIGGIFVFKEGFRERGKKKKEKDIFWIFFWKAL